MLRDPSARPARHGLVMIAAATVSVVGVALAAAGAMERGAASIDRVLVIAAAVCITLAAHLLPAMARRHAGAWALWAACLVLTVYGHAVYFSAAQARAGAVRSAEVVTSATAQALQQELAALQARPLSVVDADLAAANARAMQLQLVTSRCEQRQASPCAGLRLQANQAGLRVTALASEQEQAQRAEQLRASITEQARELDAARQSAAADPVAPLLQAGGLGTHASVLLAVAGALVIELLAALLWREALSTERSAQATPAHARPPSAEAAQVQRLLSALRGQPQARQLADAALTAEGQGPRKTRRAGAPPARASPA